MVKVGILNAESPLAGEIVRILINHPEVEITALHSPANLGRNLTSIHHGLIGESPLFFTDKLNLEDLDFIILPEKSDIGNAVVSKAPENDQLRIVALYHQKEDLPDNFELGLSEINRKALVRGAKYSYALSPIAAPILIALVPLAQFLLLNSDIDIVISLPTDLYKNLDLTEEAKILREQIQKYQNSFNGKIELHAVENPHSHREASTRITFKNSLPLEEIDNIYDQIYDDHNFTFCSHSEVLPNEVVGSQKTIIRSGKPDSETLILETVSDARMRGGAGDAVHIMNLLFGLHEKTGLNLKVARFL